MINKDNLELAEIGNDPEKGITIDKSASKTNIVLDMSKFDLFSTCKYRYYLRHELERAPRGKAESLERGSLIHESFDVYYSLLQQGQTHFYDRVQAAILRLRTLACDPEKCDLSSEDVTLLVKTAEENLEYWRHEDEQIEIILVEQPFAHVVHEDDYIRIILSGKIDILCNYKMAGGKTSYENLPIDHKSFTRAFETLRLTNQFQCYASAVGSNYLLVNKVGLYAEDSKKKPEEKFKRVILSYDPLILEEWKHNVIETILDEYLACVANNKWLQNLTSCFKYNRLCEYYPVCDSSGQAAKDYKLDAEFGTASPWDVTAVLIKKPED